MKKIYFGIIVSLLPLFIACGMGEPEPAQGSGLEKAAVHIRIETSVARTVQPEVTLQDVSGWELYGGKSGETEDLVAEFTSEEGATVELDAGTWSFTLQGYKEDALILSGSLADQTIGAEGAILAFTVEPVVEGEGAVNIVIALPESSGITSAQVLWGESEPSTLEPDEDNHIVFTGTYTAGIYYFRAKLYKDEELYGVVSEAVHVWANLESAKTYELGLEDLNRTYIITYHTEGEDIEDGYYRRTDDALTLPIPSPREDYYFRGWCEDEELSGDALTAIPTGSTGDKELYAKWITMPVGATLAETLAWISANAWEGETYPITISADESIAPNSLSYSEKTVSITMSGEDTEQTVSLAFNGSLFTVGSGVTLTLGENLTLQGRTSNTDALVRVNSGGTLVMEDGAKLTGNTNTGSYDSSSASYRAYGGGVYMSGGTFEMNGGEISGNTSSSSSSYSYSYGGGVYMSGGTFEMNGGEISGNTSYSYGGGVYMSGGTFEMNGGEISGNTSSSHPYSYGGGVYVNSGTFTQSGGEISGNTSSSSSSYTSSSFSYGGGVYVASNGIFTMESGEISGNTSSSSSSYSSSYSYSYGGGVYVASNGIFTMESGEISGNTTYSSSYSHGGGVYVDSGTFTMSSGEISGNTASPSGRGGGVYVGSGTFTMSSGEISGNTASSYGGGVFVYSNATFTKASDGTIYGSNADSALRNSASGYAYGHAVYVDSSPNKRRNSTAGESVAMNSGTSGAAGGWEYTVTFNLDGGNIDGNSGSWERVSFGSVGAENMPSNPSKTGYAFSGWYTAQNGGGTAFTATTTVTADTTVYAKWIPDVSIQILLGAATSDPTVSMPTTIYADAATTFSVSSGYASYAWYWDGELISGATSYTYTLPANSKIPDVYGLSVVVTTSTGEILSARRRVTIKS